MDRQERVAVYVGCREVADSCAVEEATRSGKPDLTSMAVPIRIGCGLLAAWR